MTWKDVEYIVKQIPHYEDGSFRFVASLAIEGEIIGPFRYEGIRADDPNDIVAHEDRRDLRGLNVFFAWFNNTDAKPSNTLDTVIEENGVRFIRHYLIDFGSALGSDGYAPKDPRFGHEFMLSTPIGTLKQIFSLGLAPAPWERARFPKLPAVGNFDSQLFEPYKWKPNYPNPAFRSRLPDDDYWATKQVMAFRDDEIRAIVETAKFTDVRSMEYIVATLAERRNKIGQTFFQRFFLWITSESRTTNCYLMTSQYFTDFIAHGPTSCNGLRSTTYSKRSIQFQAAGRLTCRLKPEKQLSALILPSLFAWKGSPSSRYPSTFAKKETATR